jgi:hypothetical protein
VSCASGFVAALRDALDHGAKIGDLGRHLPSVRLKFRGAGVELAAYGSHRGYFRPGIG